MSGVGWRRGGFEDDVVGDEGRDGIKVMGVEGRAVSGSVVSAGDASCRPRPGLRKLMLAVRPPWLCA
jgi:hypothetical protein